MNSPRDIERGQRLLDQIIVDVEFALNPSGEDCWHCGGEGFTHDCIDGCCEDAESGCELCSRRCLECAQFEAHLQRAIRIEVLKLCNVHVARAWAQAKGRSMQDASDRFVLANIHAARAGCDAFTDAERADSCCWVEGLLE